jgi:hypothetical protein
MGSLAEIEQQSRDHKQDYPKEHHPAAKIFLEQVGGPVPMDPSQES